ncbi:MAG: DUF354 domain-containing protein [Bacteroidales bacterium]
MKKKRFLFFFVHPSKFHVFRYTINALKSKGHQVDILITSKDVLEELVKREGWEYINIFPEGRKMRAVSPIISSGINFFRTIIRLFNYTKGKQYDLFITDDLLVYIGKLKKIPSIVFNDDDLHNVNQFGLVLAPASYILSPDITDNGKFNFKKIGFPGYKELGSLHPNYFKPDKSVVNTFNPDHSKYYILRLVSLRAYHDVGMKGLSNEQVRELMNLLERNGKVFITSERELPSEFEKYRIQINPSQIAHVLYYAEMFIGDSQTMTSEAAILGTPAFRCNDFAGKISVMEEKETKYGLSFNFRPAEFQKMYNKIESLLKVKNYKDDFHLKKGSNAT